MAKSGFTPIFEERPIREPAVPQDHIFVADRDQKAILVDMKEFSGEWRFRPHLKHRTTDWRQTGTSNYQEAVGKAESWVLHELDNLQMAKSGIESQVVEGIKMLSPEPLFRVKQSVDRRVEDIISRRIGLLMDEHRLTEVERSYLSVAVAELEIAKFAAIKGKADQRQVEFYSDRARELVRVDKCKAVAEQIATIRAEVRNATHAGQY
jgi:hypothetical protein